MTDLQLLLSIGIPSLLIALSIIQNNVRFTALEKRIDGLDKRADGTDAHFIRLETGTDARFTKLESGTDARFTKLEIGLEGRFSKIDADLRDFRAEHRRDMLALHEDLKQFYGMTTKLEGRMDEISKR
jgi:hypothetical protein